MNYSKNFSERKKKLLHWLHERQAEGCLIHDPISLFYYTGIPISSGILYFGSDTQILFVDDRYSGRCRELSDYVVKNNKTEFTKTVFPPLIFDPRLMSVEEYERFSSRINLRSEPSFLRTLRMRKDDEEIDCMRKSCRIAKKAMARITDFLQEGVSERELACRLKIFFLEEGAEGPAFEPIVAFGDHAARPHHTPGDRRRKKGELVLIDAGAVYRNYHSDMTRTFLFPETSDRLRQMYQSVTSIQKEVIEACRPGISLRALREKVNVHFSQNGEADLFLHSLGHGVGLEVHEEPFFREEDVVLEPGMILAIEPGLYQEGLGGIREEDTVLITPGDPEVLTRE